MSSTESAQALHDRSSDSDNEDGGSVASSSNGSSNSNSSMASSTAAPLTEQELAQRRHDDVNVRILLQSKWSRRLKATPRIRIWNMTTGGRTGRDEIVDTAIGYMAGQFAEQIQEICSAFRENLARVAAGLPPHTPATDARGAGGDSSSAADSAAGSVGGGGGAGRLAPFAFDVAAVTGVGNELPGQSAFGRSLLVRQLARAFRTQCTEGVDTHAAVDDAVPPKVESTAQLLALHEARSESESDDDGDDEGEWEEEEDEEEDEDEERYRGGADDDFDEQAPGADGSDGNGGGGGRRRVFFTLGGAADTRDGGRHDDNDDGNGGAHVA